MTSPADFHSLPGSIIRASFLHDASDLLYGEDDRLQVLALPYVGSRIAMVVLLPRDRDGLAGLEASLTGEKLAGWTADLRRRRATVALPKFKMTVKFALEEPLRSLGMTNAFNSQRADFSGMDGRPHWLTWLRSRTRRSSS